MTNTNEPEGVAGAAALPRPQEVLQRQSDAVDRAVGFPHPDGKGRIELIEELKAAAQSPPNRIHTLKTWPEFFWAVVEGRKHHEVRKNDRDFRVGDCLVLQEFEPATSTFTRDMCSVRVTYISSAFMPDGYVAMSIEPWAALVVPQEPLDLSGTSHK